MPDRPRLTPAMADVRRAIRENWDAAGVESGDIVMVACSGGADSTALAMAAKFEGDRAGILVGGIIVDHQIQEQTKAVAESTARMLTNAGLKPVLVRAVDVDPRAKDGLEAAARNARYQALRSAAKETGAKFVMLGHTLDDQAETVLLGLTRGSGPKSIAGMRAQNDIWLRPLLGIRRSQTEAFCTDSGIEFWNDPHNQDPKFTRVRIRNAVLPMLEEQLGPGIAEALARTGEILTEDIDYLDGLALAEFERISKIGPTSIVLPIADLDALPKVIRVRIYLRALEIFAVNNSRTHLTAIDQLIENWHGQKELTLPGVRVIRKADELSFKTTKTLNPGAC